MIDLSDAAADKLQAALNHVAVATDDALGAEYREACAAWFSRLTQGERWRLAMVLAAYERGAQADAQQLASQLPPAPVFPLP
jgi:DhnA family fructose-bisphosphate aldolase class Ia